MQICSSTPNMKLNIRPVILEVERSVVSIIIDVADVMKGYL